MPRLMPFIASLMVAIVIEFQSGLKASEIDLTHAVVVVPDGLSSTESKAVQVLVDEVRRRSRIGWDTKLRWPTESVPVIAVGPARLLDSFPKEYRELVASQPAGKEADGFRIQTVNLADAAPVVAVVGNDARGVLFGVGRLLRELRVAPGHVTLPDGLNLASGVAQTCSPLRASARLIAPRPTHTMPGTWRAVGSLYPRRSWRSSARTPSS